MKRTIILACFVAAALALAGCGGRSVEIPLGARVTGTQASPSGVVSALADPSPSAQTPSPARTESEKASAAAKAGPIATIGTAVAITGGK